VQVLPTVVVEQTNRHYLTMRLNPSEDRSESEFYYPHTDAVPFMEGKVPTLDFFPGLECHYNRRTCLQKRRA
jgi:hypothetical protein